jgi:hypothetical protein
VVDQGRGGPAAHLSPPAADYGASLFFPREESALSEMTIGKWFRGPNRYRRRNSSITALLSASPKPADSASSRSSRCTVG